MTIFFFEKEHSKTTMKVGGAIGKVYRVCIRTYFHVTSAVNCRHEPKPTADCQRKLRNPV